MVPTPAALLLVRFVRLIFFIFSNLILFPKIQVSLLLLFLKLWPGVLPSSSSRPSTLLAGNGLAINRRRGFDTFHGYFTDGIYYTSHQTDMSTYS